MVRGLLRDWHDFLSLDGWLAWAGWLVLLRDYPVAAVGSLPPAPAEIINLRTLYCCIPFRMWRDP